MIQNYEIKVFTKPDIDLGYFWVVIKVQCDLDSYEDIRSNEGFGYAETRKKAFADACEYYDKYINV